MSAREPEAATMRRRGAAGVDAMTRADTAGGMSEPGGSPAHLGPDGRDGSALAAPALRRPPATALRERLRLVAAALHRILGAPDYEAYLAHHARHHAGTPPLPRDEFVRRRQEERYSRPGSRCC